MQLFFLRIYLNNQYGINTALARGCYNNNITSLSILIQYCTAVRAECKGLLHVNHPFIARGKLIKISGAEKNILLESHLNFKNIRLEFHFSVTHRSG